MNMTKLSALSLASLTVFALAGCGMGVGSPSTGSFGGDVKMSGMVHGGQQGVGGSAVSLYSAGTTGYGGGAAKLASTTTDKFGSFGFSKTSSGTNNGTDNTWHCPTDGTDPMIYIIAQGGDPTGAQQANATNSAIALIAVLGPCSGISSSTGVDITEVTTAATAVAFGQYMSPGTTPGTEAIGSSGVAVTPASSITPQVATGAIGITNAWNIYNNNLVTNVTGREIVSSTYSGTGGAAGVTITATPESGKLVAIANILSACVNSTVPGNTTTQTAGCSMLFSGAVPPISAAGVSVGGTYPTATDTLQAALYMAINPSDIVASSNNTPATGGACAVASYTSNVACLYGLVGSFPAFVAASPITAAPTDWTIGINYVATGTCTNGGSFMTGPTKAAVDASGNLWFVNGVATGANYGALNPYGQPIACGGIGSTAGVQGRGITIDPTGNVWVSFNAATLAGSVQEIPYSSSAIAGGTAVGWTPAAISYAIVADGAGNIFDVNTATGASLYEFVNPGTNTTPFAPTTAASGIFGSSTFNVGYIAADHSGRIFLTGSSSSGPYGEVYPNGVPTSAGITGYTIAGGTVTFSLTGTTNPFTVSQVVNVTGLTTTTGYTLDNKAYTITAISSTSPLSFSATTTAADQAATADTGNASTIQAYNKSTITTSAIGNYGTAIDSAGNVYTGTTCCNNAAATNYRNMIKITPDTSGSGAYSETGSYFAGNIGTRALVLDGAANVWSGNELPASSVGYGISETAWSGTGTTATASAISLSGTAPATCSTTGCLAGGGFQKSGFLEPLDMAIDPSGNVWVLNTGTGSTIVYTGTSVTQIVGAAVPVLTPLSQGAALGKLATKP